MSKPAQNFEEKKDACYTINGKRRIDRPDLYSKRLKTNVFSSNEQNKKAEINIGLCCFGNYFAAFAKALTKEIELFPDRSHLYSDRAKCYVHLKVFKDSLEDGLKAVHLDRLNIDGWLCVGESHFALGTSDECVEDLEKILGETNNQKLRNFLSYSYFMEASKAFEMNKFETAAKHYESASKLSDASLWIKLKLSECYAITGQFNKALVIADQLLKEKVTEAEGYYVHGQIKYYQNIIDVAFENFDKCLFLDGGHANCKELYRLARSIYVLKDRGNKYYNEKKYDFAYEMCDKGLNADPNNRMVNAVFNFNIGLIFLQQHKVADAIRSFSSAIDLNKRYIKALLQRAKLFQEFHQFQDAVQDLEQVNKIAPSPHHENLLQEATSQLKTEPQSTKSFCSLSSTEQNKILANSKKEKGNIQYKNKNYDEAKRLFSEAIALDPVCPIHYLNRSVCLMAQKMYEEALTDAGKSLEIDSTVVKGYLRKGKIELILGRGEEALQTFVQGLTINHKDKDLNEQRDRAKKLILYISMGDKAFEIKNFTEAAVRFGDAFDIASSCSKVMNMKYESLLYCNRWDEVSLWLSQQEKDANYYYISALMDYINCHKENALTNIEKALQVESNHLKAISLKTKVQEVFYNWEEGRRALTESNFTNARRLFEKASVLDPSNRLLTARVLCDLGNCFVKQGEFLKAIDHFTQAIQSKNDLVLPYLERAKCYDRLNKFEEALKDFRNVFKLSPNLLHKQYLYKAELKLKQSKNKDYYYLLSVTRNASRDDIKRAYRRLAKLYHPDKCVTAEDKKEGKIKFKEINQAYKVLSDPLKRQEYTKRFAEEF